MPVFPAGGVALTPMAQSHLANVTWPVVAGVPLDRDSGVEPRDLGVFEDGTRIASQIEPVMRWSKDGPLRFAHVRFKATWVSGSPKSYLLKKVQTGPPAPALVCRTCIGATSAAIDTGSVTLAITTATGAIAMTPGTTGGGPWLKTSDGTTWNSGPATITVEYSGSLAALVKVSADFVHPTGAQTPFARYETRYTFWAGDPMIRVHHAVIFIRAMTGAGRPILSDLAYTVPFASGVACGFGVDGSTVKENTSGTQYALQDKHNRLAWTGTIPANYVQSDGWFALAAAPWQCAILIRDFWQHFPQEVDFSGGAMVLHLWPKHGTTPFSGDDETGQLHLHKFRCFHQGANLDLQCPSAYATAWDSYPEADDGSPYTAWPTLLPECDANGIAIVSEFAIWPLAASDATSAAAWTTIGQVPAMQKLFQDDPLATPELAYACATNHWGPVGEKIAGQFTDVENLIEDIYAGALNPAPTESYGKFIFGGQHFRIFPFVPRPNRFRSQLAQHHQEVSTLWLLFARSASATLLSHARRLTRHVASLRISRNPAFPGKWWHKGPLPWMKPTSAYYDDDKHEIDPQGLLFAWLSGGDSWARSGFELWAANLDIPAAARNRDGITLFVNLIWRHAYDFDPVSLSAIESYWQTLRAVPYSTWPTADVRNWMTEWIAAGHERSPDNGYLAASAAAVEFQSDGYAFGALEAAAYTVTRDSARLSKYLPAYRELTKRIRQEPASIWNKYGCHPAGNGSFKADRNWPRVVKQLRAAGITTLPANAEYGQYPHGETAGKNQAGDDRGATILFHKPSDVSVSIVTETWDVVGNTNPNPHRFRVRRQGNSTIRLEGLDDDAVTGVQFRPSGNLIEQRSYTLTDPGYTGLYRVQWYANSSLGIYQPLTALNECSIIKNFTWSDPGGHGNIKHSFKQAYGYLIPLSTDATLTLTFRNKRDPGDRPHSNDFTRVYLRTDAGAVLANNVYLIEGDADLVVNMPPSGVAHWYVEVFTAEDDYVEMEARKLGGAAADELFLFGADLAKVQAIDALYP